MFKKKTTKEERRQEYLVLEKWHEWKAWRPVRSQTGKILAFKTIMRRAVRHNIQWKPIEWVYKAIDELNESDKTGRKIVIRNRFKKREYLP